MDKEPANESETDNGVDPEAVDHGDPDASVPTGITGQRLTIEGWFASHADKGTRGLHLHLVTSDGQDPVFRTAQVPHLVAQLQLVSDRIDAAWKEHGGSYPFGDEPDDNDPTVIGARAEEDEVVGAAIYEQLDAVLTILTRSAGIQEALADLGRLLEADEARLMTRLANTSLLDLAGVPGRSTGQGDTAPQ